MADLHYSNFMVNSCVPYLPEMAMKSKQFAQIRNMLVIIVPLLLVGNSSCKDDAGTPKPNICSWTI